MQGDFLNSQQWLSLVFEGRNKDYGAYVQREESSDRHLKAMAIITMIALGLIFLPKVVKSVLPAPSQDVGQKTIVEPTLLDKDIDKDQVTKIDVPPPPLLKSTIIYTPPVITPDDQVSNEELMKTQKELSESTADISIATVEGVPGGTVDIADVKAITEGNGETSKSQIPDHVEVMPQFPGGDAALMKWLHDNINYPVIAQEQNIQGRVTLRFVVRPDGSVDQVEIVKGLDPSCDKEAMRVMKKMPKWIPGRQNGNAVSVYYSLPVVFKLQNN